MTTAAKVQRWTDLLAALLRFRFGATFEQLAREVPGYAHKADDATDIARAKRTFERDKDELRAFGVPIDTRYEAETTDSYYRLAPGEFYLPYLEVVNAGERSTPRKVGKLGYRALKSLAFEPDELAAVGHAAARVTALGDRLLAADAESAMRKLAFDLPLGALAAPEGEHVVARDPGDPRTLELLTNALLKRKVVTFEYRAMERDETGTRTVEPYGLVFVGCAWYLVGHDRERGAVRKFRASRIRNVQQNRKSPNTHDFELPAGFSLAEHAGARLPWELGDGEELVAEVELRGTAGAATESAALGEPVDGRQGVRRFRVRRPDAFVRWLLAFAGDARPLAPAALVEDFRRQAQATLRVHAGGEA